MNAYKCDRCGEHYDGRPAALIHETGVLDLCPGCWAIIRSTIGTPGKPLKESA